MQVPLKSGATVHSIRVPINGFGKIFYPENLIIVTIFTLPCETS